MSNLRQKFAAFMYGRNGADTLYWWSLGAILVLWVVRAVFFVLHLYLIANILDFLNTVILVLAVFRFFSRNTFKRSAENRQFIKFIGKHKGTFTLMRDRFRDRKTHVYKHCPKCKAVLRLPRTKGSHTVRCPKCSERFDMTVR